MSRIGRAGFEATTKRYFNGDEDAHKQWIARMGEWAYWLATGLPMRYGADGKPIWKKPAHPSRNETLPF
jgi:hypothetical protein